MKSSTHEVRFRALTEPVQIEMYEDMQTVSNCGPIVKRPGTQAMLQFRKTDSPMLCTIRAFKITGKEVLYDIELELEESIAESTTVLTDVSSHFLFDVH